MNRIVVTMVILGLVALGVFLIGSPASAAVYYWDGPLTGGTGNGASDGGDGTWSTAVQSWDQGNGLARVAWSGTANEAIFGGTAGAVSLGSAVTAGKVTFNTAGYTIGGSNTLTIGASGIMANESATINTPITVGNETWTIANGKTLSVGGATSFAGATWYISGGGTATFSNNVNSGTSFRVYGGSTATFSGSANLTTTDHTIVGQSTSGTMNWNSTGTLTPGATLYVGYNGGTGTFTQTAGIVKNGTSWGLEMNAANTAYNLNGGTLELGSKGINPYEGGAGFGTGSSFNFNGGTMKLTGTLANIVGAGLSYTIGAGATANIDTQSYAIRLNGAISGASAAGLLKMGSGTLTLGGVNTYAGATTVNSGSLIAAVAGAIPSTSAVTVNGSGTLDVKNAGTSNIVTLGSLSGDSTGTVDLGANSLRVGDSSTTAFGGNIKSTTGGTGGLTKQGSGKLTLSGANGYTGATLVSNGTLGLGGLQATSGVTLANGTTLAAAALTPATIKALTLGSVSTDTLTLKLLPAASAVPLTVSTSNALVPTGTTTFDLSEATLALGQTYTLLDYSGTALGNLDKFGLTMPIRTMGILVNDTANTLIGVQVTGLDSPRWTGAVSSDWDINLTQNWREYTSGNLTTYLQTAIPGDQVVFDNFYPTAPSTVNITTTVQPTSVTVNNPSTDYTFNGAGKISGSTGLTKLGAGKLTLTNTGVNDYAGATLIQAGTVALGVANALPTAGTVTFGAASTSGTLDLAGFDQQVGGLTVDPSATSTSQVIGNSSTTADSTLTYAGPGATSFSGTIQDVLGSGTRKVNVAVTGGALTLAGANTYTGTTTVSAGTLKVGADGALTNSSVTVNGGTLDIQTSQPSVPGLALVSGTITGSGKLTSTTDFSLSSGTVSAVLKGGVGALKSTGGTVVLTASNEYTGTTTVGAGTLQLGNNTAGGSVAGEISISSGATLRLYHSGPVTVSNRITGEGGVIKALTNTLTFSGDNSYSGATNVSAGTLKLGSSTALGNSSLVTVSSATVLDLNGQTIGNIPLSLARYDGGTADSSLVNSSTTAASYAGNITLTTNVYLGSGSGQITLSGNITDNNIGAYLAKDGSSNTLILSGTNSFGRLAQWRGTVQMGSDTALASRTTVDLRTGGKLDINGHTITIAELSTTDTNAGNELKLGTGGSLTFGGNNNPVTFAGLISGDGSINKAGSGTQTLSHANTYTGTTTVSGGTLAATVAGAIPSASAVTITGSGKLDVKDGGTSGTVTLASLSSVSTTSSVVLGANNLLVGDSNNTDFAGVIGSTGGGLTKQGNGSLTLSGANTYTGTTTINVGTLLVNSPGSLSTLSGSGSAVTVKSGATLGGNGVIDRLVYVESGAHLAPGASAGTLTVGSIDLAAGSILDWEFGALANDQVVVNTAGGLNLLGGSLNLYQEGTTNTWTTPGDYNLFQYTGILGGSTDNLSVANRDSSLGYTFSTTGSGPYYVTLHIAQSLTGWKGNQGGEGHENDWDQAANWSTGSVPDALAGVAFGDLNAIGTVNLNSQTPSLKKIVFHKDTGTTIQGPGSLTLDNSGTGATVTVEGGIHTISSDVVLADSAAFTMTGGSLALGGNVTQSTAGKTLSKSGPGALTLSGTNSFTGLRIDGGYLEIPAGGKTTTTATVKNGGELGLVGTGEVVGNVTVETGGAITFDAGGKVAGNLAVHGAMEIINSGSVTVTGTTTLGGTQTFTLGTGTGLTTAGLTLAQTANLNGGTLDLTGGTITVDLANGGGGNFITGTLKNVGQIQAVDTTPIPLLKQTEGTLTLSGTNNYSGGTVVTGGTLVIASAGALPSGRSLSIGSGGTLILGGGLAMGASAQSAEPVPEPGTLALLAIAGLAGIMIWRRRK